MRDDAMERNARVKVGCGLCRLTRKLIMQHRARARARDKTRDIVSRRRRYAASFLCFAFSLSLSLSALNTLRAPGLFSPYRPELENGESNFRRSAFAPLPFSRLLLLSMLRVALATVSGNQELLFRVLVPLIFRVFIELVIVLYRCRTRLGSAAQPADIRSP